MTKKQNTSKNYRRTAYILFALGITLLLVSFTIQLIFIRGTGFKEIHRDKQYQQCLTRNSTEACKQEFNI